MRFLITLFAFLLSVTLYGQNDYSMNFDGVDDYMEFTNKPIPTTWNEGSVSTWVKFNGNNWGTGGDWIFNGHTGTGDNMGLGIHTSAFFTNQYLRFGFKISPTWEFATSNIVPNIGQWYYLVGTWGANGIQLYIDGVLSATNSYSGPSPYADEFSLGRTSTTTTNQSIIGDISSFGMWNTALTQQEIQQYMNCGPIGSESGLAGYWNFEEGTGTTVYDQTSNSNDGAINGATYSIDVPEQNCQSGCTDSTANNFNPEATLDDGTCCYVNIAQNDTTICEGDSISLGVSANSFAWLLYYEEDFESLVNSEWSTSSTINYNSTTLLGNFGNTTVNLDLTNLPAHDSVRVEFDLYVIDSWDGNQTGANGPDIWNLSINQSSVLNTTFSAFDGTDQSYPGNYVSSYPAKTGATLTNLPALCWDNSTDMYQISNTVISSNNIFEVDFSANGLQDLCDESWALDNVQVYLYSNNSVTNTVWSTGDTTETITVTPTHTTTYWIEQTENGATCTDEVTITVQSTGCGNSDACNFTEGDACDIDCVFALLENDCDAGAVACGEGTVWDADAQECIVANPTDTNFDGCTDLNDLLDILSAYGDCAVAEFACGDLIEYEGYSYSTVQIGNQCWFAENLRYLPSVSPVLLGSEDDGMPHAYVYGYDGSNTVEAVLESTYDIYGSLYNYEAVEEWDLCPTGWSRPNHVDWDILTSNYSVLDCASTEWFGTNLTGLNFLPGGDRDGIEGDNMFVNEGSVALMWIEDEDPLEVGIYNESWYFYGVSPTSFGLSVRCIKD